MRKINSRSGFTLIEILVVLIIVGILAVIALPSLFKNVERNRAQEALGTLTMIKAAVQNCVMANGDAVANCLGDTTVAGPTSDSLSDNANLGLSNINRTNWEYAVARIGATLNGYTITATRLGVNGGTAGQTITLTHQTGTANITCLGQVATPFAGVCS